MIISDTKLTLVETNGESRYEGDFVMQRSRRPHMAPLQYWRNERVVYKRAHALPVIAEVVRIPEEEKKPLGSRKRKAASDDAPKASGSRSARDGTSMSAVPEETGWDHLTDPIGVVQEYGTEREISRRQCCFR
jgi:centromere protein C